MNYNTQNDLLLNKLMNYYNDNNNLDNMLKIINGQSTISLRIVDWFVTNYAKKYFTVYTIQKNGFNERFKVYNDYKLKLRAYSKKRFDPFCRWERIPPPAYANLSCIRKILGCLLCKKLSEAIVCAFVSGPRITEYGWSKPPILNQMSHPFCLTKSSIDRGPFIFMLNIDL